MQRDIVKQPRYGLRQAWPFLAIGVALVMLVTWAFDGLRWAT